MGSITIIDIFISLTYFTVILLVLLLYRNSKKDEIYAFYLPGFTIKVIGSALFALVYIYYYKYGDTFLYHRGAASLVNVLLNSPLEYFELLTTSAGDFPLHLEPIVNEIEYSKTKEEWFMVKLLSPLSLLSFNSYFVTSFFLSCVTFFGAWKLFSVLADIFPEKKTYAFAAVFLVPTVLFWGGGIMKDTITLAALNCILYVAYAIYKKQVTFSKVILLLVCCILLYKLKLYILVAVLPTLFMVFYYRFIGRDRSDLMRWVIRPILLGLVVLITAVGVQSLSNSSDKYYSKGVKGKITGYQTWHTTQGGSVYDLGEIEYSTTGIIRKIPAALNVTFFRPYFWESNTVFQLFTALESALLFVFFLILSVRLRFRYVRTLSQEPFLLAMSLFVLILGFMVGFTSYNFGALARYKIPVLSPFIFLIIFLFIKSKTKATD